MSDPWLRGDSERTVRASETEVPVGAETETDEYAESFLIRLSVTTGLRSSLSLSKDLSQLVRTSHEESTG